MFGGFGGLPKGSNPNEKKLGVVKPAVTPTRPEGSPSSSKGQAVPESVIRVTPGVAGPGGSIPVGKVDATVTPGTVGKKEPDLMGPQVLSVRYRGNVYKYWNTRKEFDLARSEGRVGIRWVAPVFDESGYGEACRNYIAAIASTGFPITTRPISFGEPSTDYGLPGRVSMRTLNVGHPFAINLVYSPPHFFKDHKDQAAYNIGMFVWEMNSMPGEWVSACNQMNEVWVPCEWNAKVCVSSGVKVPVRVFGHCVAPDEYNGIQPLSIPNCDGLYKFYSIFQWSSRKNPQGLLRAYLRAFTNNDPVILLLKTYGQKYIASEERKVREEIEQIRREVGGSQPKVLLITKMLSKAQILGLHQLGDCFFLPHRAEGWGLPHFEACMAGKPVITTNYGGNLEFTKPEHSYLVPSRPIHVSGMEWFKWFTPDMTWADADVSSCINALRHVYEHREEAAAKGQAARDFVMKTFNWLTIGGAMKGRILEILRTL